MDSISDLAYVAAPLDKGSKIEELVTKIRTRKGLKVRRVFFFLQRLCANADLSSLKSRPWTHITTSCKDNDD